MRELKFRVWEERDKEYTSWEYYLNDRGVLFRNVYGQFISTDGKYIFEQYTGLKDKNGREIYEGDIVEALIDGAWSTGKNTVGFGKAKWKLEVIHNDIRFMDVFRVIGSKNCPDRIYYLFEEKLSELEVIGNIHENPELLEAKNVD